MIDPILKKVFQVSVKDINVLQNIVKHGYYKHRRETENEY